MEVSETRTRNGWVEEHLPPKPESDEVFGVNEDGAFFEGKSNDFVQQMNTPTPEQNPTDRVVPAHKGTVTGDFFGSEQEWTATVIGALPSGKTVQVKKDPNGSSYYICYREGLERPPGAYGGRYTSYDRAEKDARIFLNQEWDAQGAKATS